MRVWGIAAVGLLLSTGCTTVREAGPRGPLGPLPTASELTTAMANQRTARSTLRCLARFAYEGPDGNASARQVLVVERPDRLRIEVLSPLGPVFVLTADADALAAFARNEATLYRGRPSRTNLQRYARVDLAIPDAVALLLGTPPDRSGTHPVVSVDPEQQTIQLWRETPGGAQVVWFDPALQIVATEDRDAEGRVLVRARFAEFAAEHAGLPTRIEVEVPAEGRHVSLQLREIEVNATLAASVFTLPTPPGVSERWLDGSDVTL